MRVAALAFGVLAGLVASLILALGGLDVAVASTTPDRQMQAIRFGLFVIANIGVFAAGVSLAAPLAGAILLIIGALAWVGASFYLGHSTDFVLITPPALLLVAAAFGIVAFIRRPQDDNLDAEPEILPPPVARQRAKDFESDEQPDMTIPGFAAEALRNSSDGLRQPQADDEWDPRKRRPIPPRAKPAFRDLDDEDEEDDEPSGFSRFALTTSSILSFGLYAALTGAALFVLWNARTGETERPVASAAAAEIATPSSPPSSAEIAPSETVLAPILGASSEPARALAEAAAPLLPALSSSAPSAPEPSSEPEENFGELVLPADPLAPPRLSDDAPTNASSAEPTASPPVLPAEQEEPVVAIAEVPTEAVPPSQPTVGDMMPFTMTARMAALRAGPALGPTQTTRAPAAPRNNTGL